MNYPTIILIAILGIILGYYLAKRKSCISNKGVSKINTQKQYKKEESKKKILELLKTKNSITNDDIENLLGVSDATATRYLDELEEENKIIAQGEGKYTYYVLK